MSDDRSAPSRANEDEEVLKEMEEVEKNPPENLEDWPTGRAKYLTFGGSEGEHSYDEGPETKLGPSGVRHHEDGSVSVDGEKVDDAEKFKGDPIPGGPTDPDSPNRDEDKERSATG